MILNKAASFLLQLLKERERLTAMMQHLHMKPNSMSPRQPATPVTPTATAMVMSPVKAESPALTPVRIYFRIFFKFWSVKYSK